MASEIRRVLLVEDDPSDARLIAALLDGVDGEPYRVVTVDRLAAMAGALGDDEPFDVVLLDLGLPDGNGLEVVHRGVEHADDTPVVILTGREGDELALEAIQCGAQDYLAKSELSPRLLRRVIRHAMERQRLLRELQQARDGLERLSMLDPLCEVLNRRGFEQVLARERSRSERDGARTSLIVLDLDGFKEINDTHGHAGGDAVLREVARRTAECVRSMDAVARIGGDEFLVLLPNTPEQDAARIAERIRCAIAGSAIETDDGPIGLTASLGLVAFEDDPRFDEMLRRADRALYESKRSGKNRLTSVVGDASSGVGPTTTSA